MSANVIDRVVAEKTQKRDKLLERVRKLNEEIDQLIEMRGTPSIAKERK